MRQLMTFITRLYASLLKAYPAPYYEQFGDEMADVFAQQLNEETRPAKCFAITLREFSDLGVNIMREQWAHYQDLKQTNPKAAQIMATKFIFRAFSIVYAAFFLWLSIQLLENGSYWNGLVTLVFETILLVGVLIGWRWQGIGAVITLTSAVTLTVITMMALNVMVENIIISLLLSLVWTLPGFCFGLMLVMLNRNIRKSKRLA